MAGPLIGALRVSLSAETASFEAGMKRAQRVTEQSANGITRVLARAKTSLVGFATAFTAGALIRAGKEALDYAASLGELASTLGLTTKDLQTFRYAAGQVGISQDELEAGIQKLTISMGKAQVGSKAQIAAFNAIGISIDQLKGKNAGDVFRMIADRLEKVSDRSKRAAVEVALFGKAGAKLDNLLSGAEGGLNELSEAAEKLGIVLSDDQIQNADRTADKLEALWTVLKAQIASDVADNSDAILEFANTLQTLVKSALDAGNAVHAFFAELSDPKNSIPSRFFQALGKDINGNYYNPSASVTVPLPPVKRMGGVGGGAVSDFLAGSGPKAKKGRVDHSAQDALRDAYQFDQDLRRAQMDVLRATQDLATDYVERTSVGIQILNAEKSAFDAEQQYQIALYKLTKGKDGISEAQAGQLKAQFDLKDSLERQALLADEEEHRAADVQELTQHDYDRRRQILEAQAAIAETASERRAVELEILRLAYEARRQALQDIVDHSKDAKAQEDARRDLLTLGSTYALDKQGVLQSTRGPMEDYIASLPTTAAKANEALQQLQVQGFDGLIDSVLALSDGMHSATDSLLNTLKQFLLGLARLELQKMLGGALQGGSGLGGILGSIGGLFGGSSGSFDSSSLLASNSAAIGFNFAGGGSGIFKGIQGIDRNVLSLNGIPFANVSYGERMTITNDNTSHSMGRGGNVYMTVNTPNSDSFRRSEGQTTRSLKRRLA